MNNENWPQPIKNVEGEEVLPEKSQPLEETDDIDPVLQKLLDKAEEDFNNRKESLERSHQKNPNLEGHEDLIEKKRDELRELVTWKYYFRKDMPDSWDWESWNTVADTFKEAKENKRQLRDEITNAGIAHPTPHVVHAVGTSQKLNTKQLAYAFIQSKHMNSSIIDDIVNAQKEKGVTENEIEEAKKLAGQFDKNKNQIGKFDFGNYSISKSEIKNS